MSSQHTVSSATDRTRRHPNPASGRRTPVLAGVALGLSALLLSGCAGNAAAGSSGMDGKTIKMFTWVGNDDEKAQWTAYVEGGKLVDPNLAVDFSGPAIGSYYTKLPTQLKGNDAPCIITLQNGRVPDYADALEPLDQYMTDAGIQVSDYDSSMITQLSHDGKLYALPYDAEPMVMYYNKALFADAGVPTPTLDWTTKDFVDAAKKTTRNGVYGFAIGQGIGAVGNFLAANDEDFVDGSGKANLDDPALEKRLQWLIDLAVVEKAAKPLEASGGTFSDIDAFSTGQAAMFINGTWDLLHEQQSIGKDNLGVAVIPSDTGNPHGSIAGTGFAVTKSCSNKEAAFEAVAAMTSAESQRSVAKSRSQVPARADALEAWQSSVGEEAASVVKVLTENGKVGVPAENGEKINTLFSQYVVDGFSGKSDAAQVLEAVSAGVGK